MENMIREGMTMSELHGALTLMVQSCAADRAAFGNAELVAAKLLIDAHNFAGREVAEVEDVEMKMINLFDGIKHDIAHIGGTLLLARTLVREAAAAVAESEAKRDSQRSKLAI